jgi:DNA/RNA-binding domain of Phe-tRNA-synthetase-like protein
MFMVESLVSVKYQLDREGLKVVVIPLNELRVEVSSKEFEKYEQEVFSEIRAASTLDGIRDDPILRAYREFYWTFGMDPTKQRVSSEAVLRRILRGLNLWRISDVVDVANLSSAYHKIPVGLIDTSTLTGQLSVRIASKGEVFHRMGGSTITCRGREIVVADEEKIVCFGYATHDSDLTKVTENSQDALFLLYGAPGVSEEYLKQATDISLDMIQKWLTCNFGLILTYRS